MMSNKQKSKNIFVQGTILAVAGIFTKLIGFVYRIPMTNMLGSDGNGVYSIAFEVYNIVLMLSSYSMPLAVSKLVSARLALKQYNNAYRVFKDTLKFAAITSCVGALFLYFGSGFLASLYSMPELARPLKVLAPTLLVVGLLGVMRGFFQGSGTMIPTAISQIFEQIFNGILSIGAIWFCMSKLVAEMTKMPEGFHGAAEGAYSTMLQGYNVQNASFGAAGGTVGTLVGAFVALLFLMFTFVIYKPSLDRRNRRDGLGITESHGEVYKTLLVTVVPVIISQTVYQVGYVIDGLLFSKLMYFKGMDNSVRKSLQGVFNSQYTLLINVPIAMATAMATSSIPSIVTSYTMGKKKEVNKKIGSIIKFVMVIAFPSAIGLSVLAMPLTHTLFPRLGEYNAVGTSLLQFGSIAVVFYSLSTITSAILQGLDHMTVPVKNSAISLSIHLVMVSVLLYFTDLGIYALLIGDITFPLLVSILNWNSVRKYVGYKQEVTRTFLIPLMASVIMGAVCRLVYQGIFIVTKRPSIGLCFSVAVAVLTYGLLILAFRCFGKKELYDLPMGGRLVALGKKMGVYR